MKKICAALVFVICAGIFNFCSANYYDDSPNYEFIGAGNGGMWYFQKSSLEVQEYNPPHYQISGIFIYYSQSANERYIVKRYNWYTKESFSLQNGYWEKDNVNGNYMAAKQTRHFANILFRAAYGMDFYGY